jgi:hypothetical protein
MRALLLLSLLLLPAAALACSGSSSSRPADPGAGARRGGDERPSGPVPTKITAFAVGQDNLRVDRIGMRAGGLAPDGNRDLVFTATVEGPADALFIVRSTEAGKPLHGFRADTIFGHEELPPELGSVVDVGRLTVWIGVVEDGRFINGESGTMPTLSSGAHALTLYVPNTGNLRPGTHLRIFTRHPSGQIVGGPVILY